MRIAGILLALLSLAWRVSAQDSTACIHCHTDRMKYEYKHAVVEQKGCIVCHKPGNPEHPGPKKGFELSEKMPGLCTGCHPGIMGQKWSHSPVKAGNCTACHSPHSSPNKKMLVTEKKKICLNCHNKSLSKDNKPVTNMLELVQTKKYLHEALKNGGCTPCHQQHGSDFPKFLIAAFPTGSYTAASKDSFDLCFQCHDSDLLELASTTTSTNFRNGDKNLHFRHMNGKKAMNCNICHDVHGTDNLHLITDKVPFGKWKLPIYYVPADSGGTCRTGCHGIRGYHR